MVFWERRAAAALLASSQAWYKNRSQELFDIFSDIESEYWGYSVDLLSGDGTNAAAHGGNKLSNLYARCVVHIGKWDNSSAAAYPKNFSKWVHKKTTWSDLQIVGEGTALASHTMVLKQLKIVGVVPWMI